MIYVYGGNYDEVNLIKIVYNSLLVNFNLTDIFNIDVNFMDEESIRGLNLQTRDIDKPTDVLSFPYVNIKYPVDIIDYPNDIDPDTGRIMLGEIMICYPIIKAQAEEYGHSIERELAYITLHGLLHLMGYDHIDECDKDSMRRKEEEILSNLGFTRD